MNVEDEQTPFRITPTTLYSLIALEDMAGREARNFPVEAGLAEQEFVTATDQDATDVRAQAIGVIEHGIFKPKRIIVQPTP